MAANADDSVRSIVITGNGPGFVLADLKARRDNVRGSNAVPYADVLTTIIDSPKPVIAVQMGPPSLVVSA